MRVCMCVCMHVYACVNPCKHCCMFNTRDMVSNFYGNALQIFSCNIY